MQRYRERVIKFTRKKIGEVYDPKTGTTYVRTYEDWSPLETQSHKCLDSTHPGPPYEEVGTMSIQHLDHPAYIRPVDSGDTFWGPLGWHYRGDFWIGMGMTPPSLVGDALAYNSMSMDALGATGWKKFKPAKPIADAGVFLGESREFPRLLRDSAKALHDLVTHPSKSVRNMSWMSNQYLCQQFGWLPLMRDLEKFADAAACTNHWLNRVRKHNGQWEHRGGVVASGEKETVIGRASLSPICTGYNLPPEGTSYGDIVATVGYKVWFSAWFKYYVADFESATTQLRLRSRIYGLTNTPLIVWNLLPWSWLVDWFTNVGDNIDNLLPADGLVAKMPCVMRHCYTRYSCTVQQRYRQETGSFKTFGGTTNSKYETKGRTAASPFGFGLTADSLSARQWSILAALGMKYS